MRCGLGGARLGLGLGHGVPARGTVDGHDCPRTCAVLAAQLDVQTGAVVLDAKAVRFVAVLVQDPSPIRFGYE